MQGVSIGAGFVLYIILLQRRGMNLFQIGLINAVFAGCILVFQVPTGIFADLYGRRLSLIVGTVASAAARILYSVAPSMGLFCLSEVLFAASWAFIAGADYAWLIDKARQLGHHSDDVTHLLTRTDFAKKAGVLVGGVAGSLIGLLSYWLPMFVSGLILLPVIWVLFTRLDEDRPEPQAATGSRALAVACATLRHSARRVTAERRLLVLGLVYAVYAAAWVSPFTNDWQPWLSRFGADSLTFGLVLYLTTGVMVVSRYAMPALLRRFHVDEAMVPLIGLLGCGGLLPVLTLVRGLVAGVAVYVLVFLFTTFVFGLETLYARAIGEDPFKASILSFQSMLYYLGFAIGSVASGALGRAYGLAQAWRLSSIAFLTVALAYAWLLRAWEASPPTAVPAANP